MLHVSPNRHGRWLPALLALTACWSAAAHESTCSASAAAANPCLVNAQTLRRTKIVNAVYPQVAKDHAWSGMVELQFTVQPDGSTADIEVINANPAGVFETSAIAALSQWRYEPVIRDGQAVRQRAVVRIKFALDVPQVSL